MKKKLLLTTVLFGAMSAAALGVSGSFEVGTEMEEYNTTYKTSDFLLPYVAGKIKPIDGSPFYVQAKYSYRYKENDDKRESDKRKRTEVYLGYGWKWDNFAFTPKFGFRHESYADLNSTDDIMNWRFYPNMSYKMTDNSSVFLSGFVAARDKKYRVEGKRPGSDTGTEFNDYNHELEFGTKHKLSSTQTLQPSIYSEITDEEDGGKQVEWQFRLKYSHKVTDKTTLSPWVRIGLDREYEAFDGETTDKLRHRVGLTASHKVSPTFTLKGEVNYQTEKKETAADMSRTFYKIAFEQKF